MKLTYKKAGIEDAKIIAELADRIWKKHYASIISMEQILYMLNKMYSEERLLQQMSEGHEFTIVYLDDRAAGYISISSEDNKNYFLHKFYVETDVQAKGIGTRLLNHILDDLKNAKTIELTVNRKNFTAVNFYFKNNFKIKSIADFDIGSGYFMNDFIMTKKLK